MYTFKDKGIQGYIHFIFMIGIVRARQGSDMEASIVHRLARMSSQGTGVSFSGLALGLGFCGRGFFGAHGA